MSASAPKPRGHLTADAPRMGAQTRQRQRNEENHRDEGETGHINEVKRVCRNTVLFSTYNAKKAHWHYNYEEFIKEATKLGTPTTIKKVSDKQIQAIVVINHD